MAFARLDRHKPFVAGLEPLEPDSAKRIRCQKAAEHQSESDNSLLHIDIPMFSLKPLARRIASDHPASAIVSIVANAIACATRRLTHCGRLQCSAITKV
jgi:hypothetical protein